MVAGPAILGSPLTTRREGLQFGCNLEKPKSYLAQGPYWAYECPPEYCPRNPPNVAQPQQALGNVLPTLMSSRNTGKDEAK